MRDARQGAALPSREELFEILDDVKDPEVPVLSVVELGIVRDAVATQDGVTITITPTYSGCPAMHEIEAAIRGAFEERGLGPVHVRTTYAPAWTTDWIGPAARAKLEAYGIAPPGPAQHDDVIQLHRRAPAVRCPFCASSNTERKSEFGSTACKSIWFCRECRQPFEEFKAI
ncbi:MAG TPA: 1,2-phenylacetyl-CoA epoxidase subunit PaaD [Gemmatimonadaceae bacterium]|nr:1,2-phenylacetyl-CoA epoxidase subunit PaaD [Gemmatimonadaceae bacterium]